MSLDTAEQAIREGELDTASRELNAEIRRDPANPKLRVFLFQLSCVTGQWDRALTQLQVAADLDATALAMAQMYREAIACERLRVEVFAGRKSPTVFGEPQPWVAWLIESLQTGGSSQAAELRARAFEDAPPSSGSIDGHPFAWIADADMRLGPVCEAVMNGRYFWVPFVRLARIDVEAPVDLRDVVWMPAHFRFANGGEAHGVIPTRYPGSEGSDDGQIRLGRKTIWTEEGSDLFTGLGQRQFATDTGEYPVMDVLTVAIDGPEPETHAGATDA